MTLVRSPRYCVHMTGRKSLVYQWLGTARVGNIGSSDVDVWCSLVKKPREECMHASRMRHASLEDGLHMRLSPTRALLCSTCMLLVMRRHHGCTAAAFLHGSPA